MSAAAALIRRPRLDRLAGGCEVVWAPAVAPVAVSPGVPLVVTVHDLSFEHRPGDYTPYERLWHRLARPRALLGRAQRVIAVSEEVRRELVSSAGLSPEKVVAVRSGPGRPPATVGELPAEVPESFVLAVGALEPRKQPLMLCAAHALARTSGLRAGLVFAGEGRLAKRVSREGGTVLGQVDDATLEALYRQALVVACPSTEEGFGFTPVEALARGTPPLVSDLPAFRETLGEGALRVPVGDLEGLADGLLRMEHEAGLRERLAAAGSEAVGRLSWGLAARETRAVLEEARRVAV